MFAGLALCGMKKMCRIAIPSSEPHPHLRGVLTVLRVVTNL